MLKIPSPMVFELTVSPRTGGLKIILHKMCSKLIGVATRLLSQIFYFKNSEN